MSLTSKIAQQMISASEAKARDLGMAVSTAIVDSEGRLFAFGRMEGSHWLSIGVAQSKAYTGALFRQNGAGLQHIPAAMISAVSVMQGQALLPMGSVTLLRDENDRVIAGIGCSGVGSVGATDELDGECARAARDAYSQQRAETKSRVPRAERPPAQRDPRLPGSSADGSSSSLQETKHVED